MIEWRHEDAGSSMRGKQQSQGPIAYTPTHVTHRPALVMAARRLGSCVASFSHCVAAFRSWSRVPRRRRSASSSESTMICTMAACLLATYIVLVAPTPPCLLLLLLLGYDA
jgi:hypothetical protein